MSAYRFPLLGLLGVLASAIALMAASGINAVLIPVRLQQMGFSNTMVGLCMAAEVASVVLVSRYVSKIVAILGLPITLFAMAAIRLVSLLIMARVASFPVWSASIFFFGMASNIFITAIIAWLSALDLGKHAGLCNGLFSSALSLGTALGPVAVSFSGFEGSKPFQLNMLIVALAILPVVLLFARIPKIAPTPRPRIGYVIRLSPAVVLSAFIGGITFFGLPAFLTLYGTQNGYPVQRAAWFLTAFMLGSVSLSPLIGILSDYIDRRYVIIACIAVGMISAIYLPLASVGYKAALGVLYFWGGAAGGIYATSMAFLTGRFRQEDHVSVGVTYTLMDCLGGTVGVALIGFAMDLDRDGLTYVISLAAIGYFIFALSRYSVVRSLQSN
ncbi:MAG: transporter [Chthoniobacteraceae bacterium]|nr:transporter [Chthoniobacteraceae bacterium]